MRARMGEGKIMEEVMEAALLPAHHVINLPEEEVYPIFRVPSPLRSFSPSMYTPQVVAIGPLHHPYWNSSPLPSALTDMEGFKILALQKMAPHVSYNELVHVIKQDEQKMLRECYGGLLSNEYGDDRITTDFALTIALDACFIAAVLHAVFQAICPYMEEKTGADFIPIVSEVKKSNAHFFSVFTEKLPRPVQKAILQDLLLVENQVPLLALKHVIKMESQCTSYETAERILELYVAALAHVVLPFSRSRKLVLASVKNSSSQAKHLLGMMYDIVVHKEDESASKNAVPKHPRGPRVKNMHSARYMQKFGVVLEGSGFSLNDISFKNGKLSIPKIHVADDTEKYFKNLIAYESSYMTERLDIISYLHFMDFLIDTPADVELLVECKIITEATGSKEKVTAMWNSLCRNTMCVFSDKYHDIADELDEYCNARWRRLWYEFYQSQLAKPWVLASLISAGALLIMTFLILWYTILLYSHEVSHK